MAIAHARQPVFVPPVGSRARMIVWKRIPGDALRAVVFTDRTPGAFAQIGPPPFPVLFAAGIFLETLLFSEDRRRRGAALDRSRHSEPQGKPCSVRRTAGSGNCTRQGEPSRSRCTDSTPISSRPPGKYGPTDTAPYQHLPHASPTLVTGRSRPESMERPPRELNENNAPIGRT